MNDIVCGIDIDMTQTIYSGNGNAIVVSGWCFHEISLIKRLYVSVNDVQFVALYHDKERPDVVRNFSFEGEAPLNSLTSGFSVIAILPSVKVNCKLPVQIIAHLNSGEKCTRYIGDISLSPGNNKKTLHVDWDNEIEDKVVICMATFNPRLDLFIKQIRSLVNQTFKNWICIISDDASSYHIFQKMKQIVEDDPRFIFIRNEMNCGFYRNFEISLLNIPDDADFIALCDQDDEWFDYKIEKLLGEFDSDTELVYSDMRLVDEKGTVLEQTYWTNRRNNYLDFEFLLLANTVTGAASIFRRRLLEDLLPFPKAVGEMYHDWWIALCASLRGNIKYISEPLYDYCQHGSNVIGHSAGVGFKKRIQTQLVTMKSQGINRMTKSLLRHGELVFEYDYLRILFISNVLNNRFQGSESRNYKTVRRNSRKHGVWGMILLYLKGRILRRDTLHAEIRLLFSVLSRKIVSYYYNANRKRIHSLLSKGAQSKTLPIVNSNILSIEGLESKISPLQLRICSDEIKRINILIPTIDFKYFFGGYLGKFNLAKKLTQSGHHVRLVIVDYCNYSPSSWREELLKYPGLENFFDIVEISYQFDRDKSLNVSPSDVFIASTWWTAHIANNSIKQMGTQGFVYLIQEYEPLTFPHGAYYALANETYDFQHTAVFSTEFLRNFFKDQSLGVYRNGVSEGDRLSVSFQNAILKFMPHADEMDGRKRKKLLFYARPETHASRNMFEVGILALQKLANSGVDTVANMDFYGMGTVGEFNRVKITNNKTMTLLPKMSLGEYQNSMNGFDLGLSLMYTPHPSLVPLEMAAAGMLVVTNTYLNKTEESLKEISSNIYAAKPNVDSIFEKLNFAIGNLNNYGERINGSKVNWSSDWDETFDRKFLEQLNIQMNFCSYFTK